jgi:hypothetical protein
MFRTFCTIISRTRAPLRRFAASEAGTITTDWIILTGAIVGLGLSATVSVRNGVGSLGGDIESSLSGASVALMGNLDGSPVQADYQRLWYSEAEYNWMETMYWNSSTDYVVANFNDQATRVETAIEQGNAMMSAMRLDMMSAAMTVAEANGHDVTQMNTVFQSSWAGYRERFPDVVHAASLT